MSYQKKSLILQELQQAIRKKAQEKSRHKDQANRVLQSSIEKKRNTNKQTIKDSRAVPVYKPAETAVKPTRAGYEPLSLFNNEQLNTIEGGEFKFKKYNNRRLDKLVSLIQYMVSSSEKAVKYISSTNFQAEFALKLYRSDKDNLMNELKTLNVQDIVEQKGEKEAGREGGSLAQQNTRLKKEILILEKEAQRWHQKGLGEFDFVAPKGTQREVGKFQEMFRKLVPFDTFKQVLDLVEREGKFEQMLSNPQENTKKLTEIEMGIRALEQERLGLIESAVRMREAKVESRSDRTFRLNEIQEEKEHLQREISNLKQKLNEIKQSSKSIGDVQLLRKSSELVNQRLSSLLTDLSKNGSGLQRKSNEQLIEVIRGIALNYKQGQDELSSRVLQAGKEVELLRRENVQLRQAKRENDQQFTVSEEKMERMIGEMQQFKGVIEELSGDRDAALQQVKEMQSALREREEKIESLNELLDRLEGERQENEYLQSNYDELKKQLQAHMKKSEEKERQYRDKIAKAQNGTNTLEDKVLEMAEELEHQRNQIAALLQQGKSSMTVQTIKHQFESRERQQGKKMEELQRILEEQTGKFKELKSTYQETVDEVVRVSKLSSEKSNRIEQQELMVQQQRQTIRELQLRSREVKVQRDDERIDELQAQNDGLRGEIGRMKTENVSLVQQLRSSQKETMNKNNALEEVTSLKKQVSRLESRIKELDAALGKAAAKIDQCNHRNNSLQTQLQQERKQFEELSQQYDKVGLAGRQNQQTVDHLSDSLAQSSSDCQQLKEDKLRLQGTLLQQQQEYTAKLHQLNCRVQAEKQTTFALNQKNQILSKSLDTEKHKTASLTEKGDTQFRQMVRLRELTASLSAQIQKHISRDEESQEMMLALAQEKEQLSGELAAAKQQIHDQIELNHHKMQQYVNLLKQILKGFQIDSEDLVGKETFEELLEFGSKQVVQMRKRLRDQESNQRRNSRREQQDCADYQLQSSGKKGVGLQLEQCKVQLFSIDKVLSPIAAEGKHIDIDEFNEFNNEDPMNSSIASQQNLKGNEFNLEEFADHEQKMNESLLSQQDAKPQKKAISNKESSASKAFESFKLTVNKDEPKIALRTEGEGSPIENKTLNLAADKRSSSIPSPKSLGNTVSFPSRPEKPEISASNSNGAANFNLRNLDEFDQVKSDEMNESLVSQQMNRKKNADDEDVSQQLGSSLQKAINQDQEEEDNRQGRAAKGNGNFILNSLGGNFFADPEDDDLDDSLHSDQERGLSDFEEVNEDRMGDSILSKKEGQHGFSEFGEVECGMGDSIVSQQSRKGERKQPVNSFSQFEQYKHGVGAQKDQYGVAGSRSKHF